MCLFQSLFLFLAFCLSQGEFKNSKDVVFDPKPSNQDIQNGDSTVLYCGVAGPNGNQFNISWLFGGKPIQYDQRRFQNGTNLYFKEVNKELDDDKFQCIATNIISGEEYESISAQFNITWVDVDRVFLKRPFNSSLIRSSMKSSVILKCGITGNPTLKNFAWFLNSKKINESSTITIRKDRLKIERIEPLTYDGVYTCCAESPLNSSILCTPANNGFNLEVLDLGKPVLVQAPADVVVNSGSSAFLHCVFRSEPPPTIIWRRKGKPKFLTNNPSSGRCKRRCIYENGTLALQKVKDNEDYECLAKQGDHESRPFPASIRLAYIYPFEADNILKVVTLGRKFEFHCEVPKALPPAQIIWKRLADNKTIDEDNGHVTKLQNILVIDNIQREDLGSYECVASNIAGTESMGLVLTLAETAIFGELMPQTAIEGSNVTWVCPVRNTILAEVVWLKDGLEVVSDSRRKIVYGLKLTLISVNVSDEGLYYCTIKSKSEISQARSNFARLQVTDRFKFSPPLRNTCVTEGERSEVPCIVNRVKAEKFKWKKVNGTLGPSTSQERNGQTLRLVFDRTSRSDSGVYQCAATFGADTLQGQINVTVVTRPVVQRIRQKIIVFQRNSILLHCPIAKIKHDDVIWNTTRRYDKVQGRYSLFQNGSLLINQTQIWDAGTYSCSYVKCGYNTHALLQLQVIRTFTNVSTFPVVPQSIDDSNTMLIVILSLVAGIACVMCTSVLIYCCRRKQRLVEKARPGEEEKMLNGFYSKGRLQTNNNDDTICFHAYSDTDHKQLNSLAYSAENINPVTVIGKGEFGDIFLSKAPGLFPDLEDDILVMVKSLDWPEMVEKRSNFYQEVNLLHKSNHENIVKLLAVCFAARQPLLLQLLVTEYLEWGILKLCLEASKHKRIPKFTKQHKMSMCCQIACALDHLEGIGLRHGDVATRNCVVSSQLLIKLSVLGLNEEGFEKRQRRNVCGLRVLLGGGERLVLLLKPFFFGVCVQNLQCLNFSESKSGEYCQVGNKRLPIRWMAPETLFEGQCTSKSDVWSFAVVCWEIFTLGQLPHENYTNQQLIQAFQSDSPPCLPPLGDSRRITSLIKKCCQLKPSDRPEINQIMLKLQSISYSKDGDVTNEDTSKSDNLTDINSEKLRQDDND